MTLKNDSKLMFEPYSLNRKAGMVPKTLTMRDERSGEEYFFEPEIVGNDMSDAKIFYNVPIKFARKMLVDERFKLVKPDKLVISYQEKYATKTKIIKAVKVKLGGPAMTDEQIEELNISSEEKRAETEEALQAGKVPEHMKETVEELEEKNKQEVKNVAAIIAAKKKKKGHEKTTL